MKKYFFTILLFFISQSKTIAQEVSCDDLMNFVTENGSLKGSVSPITLLNSAWLKEVNAYTIENKIIVIAEIKRDEFGIRTKKYIFCGISSYNWDAFYYGLYDLGKTHGERFNKYIIKNQCRCE